MQYEVGEEARGNRTVRCHRTASQRGNLFLSNLVHSFNRETADGTSCLAHRLDLDRMSAAICTQCALPKLSGV